MQGLGHGSQLAAWEVGSGCCRWHVFYQIAPLTVVLGGVLAAAATLGRAFVRGRGCRNPFGQEPETVLAMDRAKLEAFASV